MEGIMWRIHFSQMYIFLALNYGNKHLLLGNVLQCFEINYSGLTDNSSILPKNIPWRDMKSICNICYYFLLFIANLQAFREYTQRYVWQPWTEKEQKCSSCEISFILTVNVLESVVKYIIIVTNLFSGKNKV